MKGKFYFLLNFESVKDTNEAFLTTNLESSHCDSHPGFVLLIFDLCSVEVFLSQLTTNGANVKVRAANAPPASVAPSHSFSICPFLLFQMQNIVCLLILLAVF